MNHNERQSEGDEYWTDDVAIGEGQFYRQSHTLRLALHQSQERYFSPQELFPLQPGPGARLYFHARPYVLIPDIRLRVTLYPRPSDQALGTVESVTWEGMRHEVVGNAQGWAYPAERASVLWECFLEERHRLPNPLEDPNLQLLWKGFEQTILDRSAGVNRLYTTWEPIYPRLIWQQFLHHQGYEQTGPAVFLKEVGAA